MGTSFDTNKIDTKVKSVKEEPSKTKVNVLDIGKPSVMTKEDINKYRINSYKFAM